MSEEKFTPGPWEIKLEAPYLLQVVKAGDKRVAMVPTRAMSSGDAKEAAANAHLIAAAPELYEAVESFCLGCVGNEVADSPCGTCYISKILKKARGKMNERI